MADGPLRIIQISDTHIFSDPEQIFLGIQTSKSLEAVLNLIRQDKNKIDLIIHSGDLTQDYSEQAYLKVADLLSTFNVPVYCVPGNHDDPNLMKTVYPRGLVTNDKQIVTQHWQIILLDSHKPNSVDGYLDTSQLNFLRQCLTDYPNHYATVLFHHHPLPVGSRWLDNLCLKNADELWDIIYQFPKVNTVLFGHVHQEFNSVNKDIKCYSSPSTCHQFMRNQDHFGLEFLPPGYRWINFYDDGRVETEVVRVPHYIGKFDAESKGY